MKKIYISSPYIPGNSIVNIKNQMDVADQLMDLGFVPFMPMYSHFQHLIHPRPFTQWLKNDLEWLRVCDALLRLPGESEAAEVDVEFALELNIPVIYSIDDLSSLNHSIKTSVI